MAARSPQKKKPTVDFRHRALARIYIAMYLMCMTTTAKRMTKGEAARQIAAILAQLPAGTDLEQVCGKAARVAQYEIDLRVARADWPKLNEERAEEGETPLSWIEYLRYAKEAGEWEWPIPKE